MTEAADQKKGEDVALVLGASAEGERVAILRKRDEQIEAAILHKAEEGRPLTGDLVRLKARDASALFDVETIYEAPERAPRPKRSPGPAQVATDRYRRGWDRLFAKRRRRPN